jgi:Sec-independent protein translocase protein TatA
MGIGFLEILVILLVGFLALGPSRSISMAKTAGKVMTDLRRTFTEVAAAAGMEQATGQAARTPFRAAAPTAAAPVTEDDPEDEAKPSAELPTGDGEPSAELPTGDAEPSAELPAEPPAAGEGPPPTSKPEESAG